MVNVFTIMYIVTSMSVLINISLIGMVFVFPDLRRAVSKWRKQRWGIKKREMLMVTMLNKNKSSTTHLVKVDAQGLFSIDGMENAKYTVNAELITINEDNFATGLWETGNGTQIDLYELGKGEFTNAHLNDAALKMAMAASDAGPIFELNVFLRRGVPILIGISAIFAAAMIVVALIVFEMAGNVSSMMGGTSILA